MDSVHSNQHRLTVYAVGLLLVLAAFIRTEGAHALNVSTVLLQVQAGNAATVRVKGAIGRVSVRSSNADVATADYDDGVIVVRGRAAGSATVTVWDKEDSRRISVAVTPGHVKQG
jgi:hypothetical protein